MTTPAERSLSLGARSTLFLILAAISGTAAPLAASAPAPPVPLAPLEPSAPGGPEVVGILRVEAPDSPTFLLHGTLPLPRGSWVQTQVEEPFIVLDHDGTPVATQCEIVSRYASTADGVDVAEVRARVKRPPGAQPGDQLTYQVAYQPHSVSPDPAPSVAALGAGPTAVPTKLKKLLANPYGIVIEARDVFGHSYLALPLLGVGSQALLKHGPMTSQLRIGTTLVPAPPVAGHHGTLPHHLGVTTYLTVNSEDSMLGIDVRFHNAHSGLDPNDPLDDPLGDVYFESINLYVPDGWAFVQGFLDPYLSLPVDLPFGYRAFSLVSATPEGMHGMEWQAQFHRRLMLAPNEEITAALPRLRGEGLGFATRGVSPQTGEPLWSWWNAQTARWFPQSHRLPSLAHVDQSELDAKLEGELYGLEVNLFAGTATGSYPVLSSVLGHAHPYGVKYGGMTGGVDIHLFDGIQTLERASLAGYGAALLAYRMTTNRMPNLLTNADGQPSSVRDWLVEKPDGQSYVPFKLYNTPSISGDDPFGLHAAPTFQVEFVENNGLAAPFVDELAKYDPIDIQHYVRHSRLSKTLTWMANDSLAKDDLRAQAEVFHLSYHTHYNSPGGYAQSTGLRFDQEYIATYGPVGFTFGRGEGWGLDCAVAAYATSPPAWRAAHRTWFDNIGRVVRDGQSACTGFIQSTLGSKFFDGQLHARQIIEQSIIENALVGLIETVYRGEDAVLTSMLEGTLKKSLYSMLNPISWSPGKTAPWAYSAVGPKDEGLPPYCDLAEAPSPSHSDWTDGYQNWSSFAYGFELTGDPVFLQAAEVQIEGELVGSILADGAKNVQNRAALLALVQELIGMP